MSNAWIKKIQKGDILRTGKDNFRVVRNVSHGNTSAIGKTYVTFSIQRCSWTTRCYTVYTGIDLVTMKYRPTTGKMKLNTKFDKLIEAEFARPKAKDAKLHCCDVKGIS